MFKFSLKFICFLLKEAKKIIEQNTDLNRSTIDKIIWSLNRMNHLTLFSREKLERLTQVLRLRFLSARDPSRLEKFSLLLFGGGIDVSLNIPPHLHDFHRAFLAKGVTSSIVQITRKNIRKGITVVRNSRCDRSLFASYCVKGVHCASDLFYEFSF